MTDDEIKDIEKRTRQYFYEDGFIEIAVGILFLMLGGYFFATVALPATSRIKSWLDASFVLVILAGLFLVGRLVRFLKFRITYPRTGYVAYKKKEATPRRRAAAAVSGGVIGAAFSVLLAVSPSVRAWLPALNGLLIAFACHLFARRADVMRFHILAVVSAVIGLAVALAGIGDIKGISLYYGVFGAAMIVSGIVAFSLYLRRSRTDEEGGHER
ncbi:MAG: hypothetical protein A2W03_15230 [Candidatus Aminicenantes bacterium RBG_16_63_16]|nr:MAG: hypothetical protein A2W03_15230 [Candidatus Aminicenantes bacterium RBG_16_63_16]